MLHRYKLSSIILLFFIFTPWLLFSPIISNAQTLNRIKDASDDHNNSSSNGGSNSSTQSNSSSSNNDSYNYDSDDSYGAGSFLIDVATDMAIARQQNRERRAAELGVEVQSLPKEKHRDFSLIRGIDERKVIMTQLKFYRSSNYFFTSIRYNHLYEPRARDNDAFSTFEFHFIGFNTMSKPFNFAMSGGIYSEITTGALYWEQLARVEWEIHKGISLNAEGRLAANKGVLVRTEGSISALATLKEWNNSRLQFGAFFTSALYFEKIPVENAGMHVRVLF